MNRKQLTLLVVLLVVLGAAGMFIQSHKNETANSGETGTGAKLLGDKFPVNDVTHIVIKSSTNELNLVKKDDSWRVKERNDYPASYAQISEFLIKASGLKIIQREEIGASQLARMQLAAPGQGTNSGTLLDLRGKDDKSIKSIVLGKKHAQKSPGAQAGRFGDEGAFDGRYVMTGTETKYALLISDPLSNIEPKPETWLNKDFFRIDKPKVISVAYPAAVTNSWKLTRDKETADWTLTDLKKEEKVDSGKIAGVTSPFGSPTFNDVMSPTNRVEDNGLDKPTIVNVETFDGFTYTIKIGRKSGEDYPINMAVAGNFPKERAAAKDEKPEDKDKADKAWKEQQKQLEEKLKREQAYTNWTYLLPTWNVDPVLKERKDLLAEKKDEKSPGAEEKKDDATPTEGLTPPLLEKKP